MKERILIITILTALVGFAFSPAPQSIDSHDSWNSQLQQFVSSTGTVNYSAWKQEEGQLDAYLSELESTNPASLGRNAKLAFWINAYNAYTVKLILKNYPLRSITDLGSPWDQKFITINGTTYSLNDIEHKILRGQLKEYRVHFAVNCASISCPPLLNKAYTAGNVQSLLDSQARKFINSTRYNSISGSELRLSKIFEWYREDFERSGTLVSYLNQYANSEIPASASVGFQDYNWNLNGN